MKNNSNEVPAWVNKYYELCKAIKNYTQSDIDEYFDVLGIVDDYVKAYVSYFSDNRE